MAEDCSRTYLTRSQCPAGKSETKPFTTLLSLLTAVREAGLQCCLRLQQFERLVAPVETEASAGQLERTLGCQICSQSFDAEARLPMSLPCGHTLCRDCVKMIRRTGPRALCPYDRRDFSLVAESIQINSPVLELVIARTQGAKIVCGLHQQPYVGFCLLSKQLKCGVCVLSEKESYCVTLQADDVERRREEVRINLSKAVESDKEALGLWNHAEELLSLFLEEQDESNLPPYHKQLSSLLDNVFNLAQDLTELTVLIIASLSQRLHQLQTLVQAWPSLSLVQQLSIRKEEAFGHEEVVELLNVCSKLLQVRTKVE